MSKLTLPGLKQGTKFAVYLDYTFEDTPDVFPASDLSAQVRADNNLLLTQLTVEVEGTVPGRFIASATAQQTAVWPVGYVYFDVKRTSGGVTTATDTVCFSVVRKVTA